MRANSTRSQQCHKGSESSLQCKTDATTEETDRDSVC